MNIRHPNYCSGGASAPSVHYELVRVKKQKVRVKIRIIILHL